MDELIKQTGVSLNLVSPVDTWEMLTVLLLSAGLASVLAYTYVRTHSGVSYSASFTQTIIFVGFTIALIMVIIGSNIARAFALVGAMSIIRFRNPVKDSRDVAFLFMAMAIGMAVGTKFYIFATIFTLFGCFIAVLMHHTGFAKLNQRTYVLRLRMSSGSRDELEKVIGKYCVRYSLVSVDPFSDPEDVNDYIYEISLEKKTTYESIISAINDVNQDIAVTLLVGEGVVDA